MGGVHAGGPEMEAEALTAHQLDLGHRQWGGRGGGLP